MKKTLLLLGLVLVSAFSIKAQSLTIDNLGNSGGPSDSTSGLIYTDNAAGTALALWDGSSDLNMVVMAGATSGSLSTLVSLTGSGAITFAGSGQFLDTTGNSYAVAGAGATAFFQIYAWLGNYASYNDALTAGGSTAVTGVFSNPVAAAPNFPPNLSDMPSMVLAPAAVPEPTTIALLGLGAASLLVFRRRK